MTPVPIRPSTRAWAASVQEERAAEYRRAATRLRRRARREGEEGLAWAAGQFEARAREASQRARAWMIAGPVMPGGGAGAGGRA